MNIFDTNELRLNFLRNAEYYIRNFTENDILESIKGIPFGATDIEHLLRAVGGSRGNVDEHSDQIVATIIQNNMQGALDMDPTLISLLFGCPRIMAALGNALINSRIRVGVFDESIFRIEGESERLLTLIGFAKISTQEQFCQDPDVRAWLNEAKLRLPDGKRTTASKFYLSVTNPQLALEQSHDLPSLFLEEQRGKLSNSPRKLLKTG